MTTRGGQEGADLGVLDPAGGAGGLAGDPGGVLALLEEAGLVEDQDGRVVAQRPDDIGPLVVADLVGAPVGAPEKVLDAIGGILADLLGELPGVLPLHGGEQADEIGADTVACLAACGPLADATGDLIELSSPLADIFGADGGAGAGHGNPPGVVPWPDYTLDGLVLIAIRDPFEGVRSIQAIPWPANLTPNLREPAREPAGVGASGKHANPPGPIPKP